MTLRNFPTRFPDVRYMGFANIDFSLLKDIPIFRERVKTQIRADGCCSATRGVQSCLILN